MSRYLLSTTETESSPCTQRRGYFLATATLNWSWRNKSLRWNQVIIAEDLHQVDVKCWLCYSLSFSLLPFPSQSCPRDAPTANIYYILMPILFQMKLQNPSCSDLGALSFPRTLIHLETKQLGSRQPCESISPEPGLSDRQGHVKTDHWAALPGRPAGLHSTQGTVIALGKCQV